jgi:hypothetical protein
MRLTLLGLVCLAALAGCNDVQHNEVLDGPYRLVAQNQAEDMAICYQSGPKECVSRVDSGVFKVGFNKDYVVAARHPANGPGVWASADRSKTEYFYIVRADDRPDAGPSAIRGPFTAAEFEHEKSLYPLPPFSRDLHIHWITPCNAKACE